VLQDVSLIVKIAIKADRHAPDEYVESETASYYVTGTRIGLDIVAYDFAMESPPSRS